MLVRSQRSIVVRAAHNCVEETLARPACSGAEQCVGDGTVGIVDHANRGAGGGGLNVQGHGDGAVSIDRDIRSTYVFGEYSATNTGERSACHGSPLTESPRDKAIRRRVRQDRAEIALIGVISDGSRWPHKRLTGHARIEITGARNILRAAGT